MKNSFLLAITLLCSFCLSAQQELHIHHINVEDGDATMIGIYDIARQAYTSKILIDGGNSNPDLYLLPYISKVCAHDASPGHFNYIVLTHYHKDHYNGLLALRDGRLTADSLIDPGGYDFTGIFGPGAGSPETAPANLVVADSYIVAITAAAQHNPAFLKGRSRLFLSFGTTAATSIGKRFTIGRVGNNPVELECVAGWGNTLGSAGIVADPAPGKNNPNDFTLSWVIHCGEFRYFIGGDLGGQDKGEYIDQETTLSSYLATEYPDAHAIGGGPNVAGHICGFKADHHGSKTSNDAGFIEAMHPAITVTSAGKMPSWHLPSVAYIQELANLSPLTTPTVPGGAVYSLGVYFTNLYNFSAAYPSLDQANSLFSGKPGISYDYGNNTGRSKAGYLVKVQAASLCNKSSFQVYRVDINSPNIFIKLADFACHEK